MFGASLMTSHSRLMASGYLVVACQVKIGKTLCQEGNGLESEKGISRAIFIEKLQ